MKIFIAMVSLLTKTFSAGKEYKIENFKFLTAEAVLVIVFTSPPPHPSPIPVKNASSIAILLLRHYYGIY
jgi:hypothetical protein